MNKIQKPIDRLEDFKKILKTKGLDGAVITNPINIFYLAGFRGISPTERESVLVSTPRATLVAPRLYQNEARKLASKSLRVEIVAERHLMFEKAKDLLKKCTKIGFEENDLRFSEYQFFKLNIKNLVGFPSLVEQMRLVKTADEIAKIEKAQRVSQKAFDQIVKNIKIGQSEQELAEKLAKIIKSQGAQGLAFESIIASGPNSGKPHHATGKRKIKKGDLLLLDFGAKFTDYHADLSRTVSLGKPTASYSNIFHHVLGAQKKAIEKIAAGLTAAEIYHETNNYFKKHKLDQYFLHGLGHGVGLEIHEAPYLRPQLPNYPSIQLLTDGMVFSVEPGLYFPWGGVRIEDLVVVKNGRAKLLGKQSADLIEIG